MESFAIPKTLMLQPISHEVGCYWLDNVLKVVKLSKINAKIVLFLEKITLEKWDPCIQSQIQNT